MSKENRSYVRGDILFKVKFTLITREEYDQWPDEGGTMGRWNYESTTLDPTTGQLTLHNATRIPRKDGIIEEEFLIDGENKPRDIILQTRVLTPSEQTRTTVLRQELGMTEEPRVIVRDESATFHRIYGAAAEGIPFVREDILSEGNDDQIKEALDHERRELTPTPHGNIRQEQYQGDLRSLITELSDRDKSELGGIDFNPTNLNLSVTGKVYFDLPLETIRKFQTSTGMTFQILKIEKGVDLDSMLNLTEKPSHLPQ